MFSAPKRFCEALNKYKARKRVYVQQRDGIKRNSDTPLAPCLSGALSFKSLVQALIANKKSLKQKPHHGKNKSRLHGT